jgi:hypothetical protein
MIRSLPIWAVLIAAATPAAAQAQAPQPPATPPAMRFEWVQEGPSETCGERCRSWISARGYINHNTPRIFVEFMRGRYLRGAVVVLESEGGSLGGSVGLGRLFRRLGLTTTVGHTAKVSDGGDRATLSPKAICASACAFSLLGGARRHVPAQAYVLVHQIWPFQKREDAVGANYNAQDLVVVQRELGVLARYIVEMGADIEFFEIAERIPPWENPRPISGDDLRRLRVSTVDDPFAAVPAPSESATVASLAPNRPLDVVDRAWITRDGAGVRGISRRHPLTLEGEQIGAFELAFTCAKDGAVNVAYNETRHMRGGADERLAAVAVRSGKDYVILKVQSSAADPGSSELRSTAEGAVPPALLSALTTSEGRGLAVATQTASNTRTVIHPGNTGFAEGLRRTVADCGK